MSKRVCLDWYSGASAQIEVFSPDPTKAVSDYRLKYSPPFRHTLRPPLEDLHLGPGELAPLNEELEEVVKRVQGARGHGAGPAANRSKVEEQMQLAGSQLFDLIIPRAVAPDLRTGSLFLEFGIDEQLVQYPWELLHDGDDFLCLKHSIGRYVNSTTRQTAAPLVGFGNTSTLDKIRILLISVPNPKPRAGHPPYPRLPCVETETQKIVEAVAGIDYAELTLLKNATFNEVYNALRQDEGFQIIHYSGHATFNSATPYMSGLVLDDRDMTTGPLSRYFGKSPPVLCFINGCESSSASGWAENYDIFGLAQSLLSTGSYLLGSRWKLQDAEAATFASHFYGLLLKDLKPVGVAMLEARKATKVSGGEDNFAWAAYTFYGDPRICFRVAAA